MLRLEGAPGATDFDAITRTPCSPTPEATPGGGPIRCENWFYGSPNVRNDRRHRPGAEV